MRVDRFDFELPAELIAQEPAESREAARLLLLGARQDLEGRLDVLDSRIADLAEHVEEGTLVVVNDTKVVRARILGTKEGTGGRAEVFLVRKLRDGIDDGVHVEHWEAMGRASKALRDGTRIVKGQLQIDLEGKTAEGLFLVRLSTRDGSAIEDARQAAGQVPLPPYIKREVRREDEQRYQTVYARAEGAVAAPTAGLHLTRELMQRLTSRGCEIAACTLHVGLGTFQHVTAEDLDDHPMHAEYYEVSRGLATSIARARERGAKVLAIGTTVVRALESARDPARPGHVSPGAAETRILIQPGYPFGVVDRLLTNFHLPKSTLLALVCAFGGFDRVMAAYRHAVRQRYRFFSYGDAMLLDRAPAFPSPSEISVA